MLEKILPHLLMSLFGLLLKKEWNLQKEKERAISTLLITAIVPTVKPPLGFSDNGRPTKRLRGRQHVVQQRLRKKYFRLITSVPLLIRRGSKRRVGGSLS